MKRYIVGVSRNYFFLRDGDDPKDLCAFMVGDYVKVKALLKEECNVYIEEIVITKERTWLGIHDAFHNTRERIPVDTIETMEVIE